MTSTLLWAALFVLLAVFLLALIVRGFVRLFRRPTTRSERHSRAGGNAGLPH